MSDLIARAKRFLLARKYKYRSVFLNPNGEAVLADLAVYCFAAQSTIIDGDRDKALVAQGRREVGLRIQSHLRLTDEQIWQLYDGRNADV